MPNDNGTKPTREDWPHKAALETVKVRKKRRDIPRPRDHKMMAYLLENGFATAERFRCLFWKNPLTRAHARRLRALVRNGFVEAYVIEEKSRRCVYRLSKKGLRYLKKKGIPTDQFRCCRAVNKSNFIHDDYLQDLRQILEKSPLVSRYCAEHVIRVELAKRHGFQKEKDSRYKVPDAIFSLAMGARVFRVALELEIAPKSKGRMTKILRLLSTSPDFNLVFFVVKDEGVVASLGKMLLALRATDPAVRAYTPEKGFYFAFLDDLLRNGLDGTFRGEGKSFTLTELAKRQESHRQAKINCISVGN